MTTTEKIARVENAITESAENAIKLPKYTNKKVTVAVDCYRCGGTGIYSQHHGACWGCQHGKVGVTRYTKVFPAGSTEEQAQCWMQEIKRRAELRSMKKQLQHLLDESRGEAIADAAKNDFLAKHEGLADALKTDHRISVDLSDKLDRSGYLSDAQVALAFRLTDQAKTREEENANASPAPSGRVVVTGTVLSVDERENDFGYVWKMLVKSDEGFKVWSSVPRGFDVEELKGKTVTFKVTLKPSNDDPTFAFGSRPFAC